MSRCSVCIGADCSRCGTGPSSCEHLLPLNLLTSPIANSQLVRLVQTSSCLTFRKKPRRRGKARSGLPSAAPEVAASSILLLLSLSLSLSLSPPSPHLTRSPPIFTSSSHSTHIHTMLRSSQCRALALRRLATPSSTQAQRRSASALVLSKSGRTSTSCNSPRLTPRGAWTR